MSNEEERITKEELAELVNQGEYWEALGLQPDANPEDVHWKVIELSEVFPGLGGDLNQVQIALTEKFKEYECAYKLRNLVRKKVGKSYGKKAVELFITDIWRNAQEKASSHPNSEPTLFVPQILKIVSQGIKNIPALEITFSDILSGQANITFHLLDCKDCKDTGVVKCNICRGRGGLARSIRKKELIKLIEDDNLYRRLWEREQINQGIPPNLDPSKFLADGILADIYYPCKYCDGRGEKSCKCTSKMTAIIPAGVKAGWIVKASSSKYFRISKIVPITISQLNYGIKRSIKWLALNLPPFFSPWYDLGQLISLIISVSLIEVGPVKIMDSFHEQFAASITYISGFISNYGFSAIHIDDISSVNNLPEIGLSEWGGLLLLLAGWTILVLVLIRLRRFQYILLKWTNSRIEYSNTMVASLYFYRTSPPLDVSILKFLYYLTRIVSSLWVIYPAALALLFISVLSLRASWEIDNLFTLVLSGYGLIASIQMIMPALTKLVRASNYSKK